MSKRLLYLSDTQLLAYQTIGKTLTEVQRFQPTAEGQAQFINYLVRDPQTPIIWLVDTAQEEYQNTHLPHVFGKDRQELLSHKMKRLFEYTPYAHAVIQGRETQGRGDDRVLFLALHTPAMLQPWLDLITTYKQPLAGICSVPLLTQSLLKYLPKTSSLLLVAPAAAINEHSPSGLRQSFFVNQQLQFSRLIPLATLPPKEYAEYVFDQILKTQRYLENARRLPPDLKPSLSVIILSETSYLQALKHFPAEKLAGLQVQALDIQEVAHQIGLHSHEPSLRLHHLIAYQTLRKRWSTNHYARSRDTRYFFYRKVRLALYLTSFFLVSSAVTASGWIFNEALQVRQKRQELANHRTEREARLEELNARVLAEGLPMENIIIFQNVVDIGRHLQSLHQSPTPTLEKLSKVLTRHPNIFLKQLEWGIGNTPAEIFDGIAPPQPKPQPAPLPQPASPPTRSGTLFGNRRPLVSQEAPKPELPDHFVEALRVHGKIYPFGGNYQNAVQLFEKFVTDLRKQQADFSRIKELSSPNDSKNAFQGQIGSTAEELEAPFAVEIVIEHRYPKKQE